MQIEHDVSIAPLTTLKIGGTADTVYIPESEKELCELLKNLRERSEPYYILGNGSNLLVCDGRLSRSVVRIHKACLDLEIGSGLDSGWVRVGASLDIRKMVMRVEKASLAAPVELLTIPATVGGAIFMNAGRGSYKVRISDNLVDVRIFDGNQIRTLDRESCRFAHRYSIFHEHRDWIILGATFYYQPALPEETKRRRVESLNAAKDKSYMRQASAGSLFKTFNTRIMKRLMGLRIGKVELSPTTQNTCHNLGQARARDALWLIRIVQLIHFLCLRRCKLEVEIWR